MAARVAGELAGSLLDLYPALSGRHLCVRCAPQAAPACRRRPSAARLAHARCIDDVPMPLAGEPSRFIRRLCRRPRRRGAISRRRPLSSSALPPPRRDRRRAAAPRSAGIPGDRDAGAGTASGIPAGAGRSRPAGRPGVPPGQGGLRRIPEGWTGDRADRQPPGRAGSRASRRRRAPPPAPGTGVGAASGRAAWPPGVQPGQQKGPPPDSRRARDQPASQKGPGAVGQPPGAPPRPAHAAAAFRLRPAWRRRLRARPAARTPAGQPADRRRSRSGPPPGVNRRAASAAKGVRAPPPPRHRSRRVRHRHLRPRQGATAAAVKGPPPPPAAAAAEGCATAAAGATQGCAAASACAAEGCAATTATTAGRAAASTSAAEGSTAASAAATAEGSAAASASATAGTPPPPPPPPRAAPPPPPSAAEGCTASAGGPEGTAEVRADGRKAALPAVRIA